MLMTLSINPGKISLLLGGARSGKSSRAEMLAAREKAERVVYVATYATIDPLDPEMALRVRHHQSHRPSSWQTVENRFDLDILFMEFCGAVVLVDCLTLWLSWWQSEGLTEARILELLAKALDTAHACGIRLYVVSNELGMGIVPMGEETRAFRDLCGRANQLAASMADSVEFMIAGLPMKLK